MLNEKKLHPRNLDNSEGIFVLVNYPLYYAFFPSKVGFWQELRHR